MQNMLLTKILFYKIILEDIETEGIKYAGSKDKIIPHLLRLVYTLKPKIVPDGFSGTTRVSQAFANLGYNVIANDLSIWSKIFAQCYLLNNKPKDYYLKIIHYLNTIPGKYGWFSEYYWGDPTKKGPKKSMASS